MERYSREEALFLGVTWSNEGARCDQCGAPARGFAGFADIDLLLCAPCMGRRSTFWGGVLELLHCATAGQTHAVPAFVGLMQREQGHG